MAQADRFVVPSAFARDRLAALGARLGDRVTWCRTSCGRSRRGSAAAAGRSRSWPPRLAPEKGVALALDACARAGVPLVVAGDGPAGEELRERTAAAGHDVRFAGRLDAAALGELRATAALAIVPSRSAETFGLAAAEAMADAVPVVATRIGALPELVPADGLVRLDDGEALAAAIRARFGDAEAGARGLAAVRERCAPETVAGRLRRVYDAARGAPVEAR